MSLNILLDKAFGHLGKESRSNEVLYFCPKCNHHKPKLSINLETHFWKCWICNKSNHTAGKSIKSLFNLLKVPKAFYDELKRYSKVKIADDHQYEEKVRLPSEFLSLLKTHKNFEYNHAMHYLKRRGVTPLEILKYNIGYCKDGDYKNRIIIPSYDENGELNYFVSRSWEKEHPLKYKNPPVSKDIVGFELFVNWNLPLFLCEGVFDAMAIKRNAIPLFGKNLPRNLKLKIIQNNVKDVFVILDEDALADLMVDAKELKSMGVNVRAVELKEEDPSDLGYKKIHQLIRDTKPFSLSQQLHMKLSLQ